MLQQFGLTEKIHAVNTDNATLNNMQATKLNQLDNTFDEENQVQCFNHTLQLSAKALLKPFNIGLSGKAADNNNKITPDDDGNLTTSVDDEGDKEDEEDEENEDEQAGDKDDKDDNINELEELSEDEKNQAVEETAVVHETVTKVSDPIVK